MDALALLRLQIEWGADEALADEPVDRLRPPEQVGRNARELLARQRGPSDQSPPVVLPPTSGAGGASPGSAAASAGTAAERAAAAAGRAQTLDELRAAIVGFDGCVLRDTAANSVFAVGTADAGLLLIGEPPGEAEDRSGTPFAGPDGALLDRMLSSIGLKREEILLVPLIPWRPPGGRPPSTAELTICLPFLQRLIALAQPRRVVLAGTLTARSLLGPVRRRGQPAWAEFSVPGLSRPVQALTMPSPRAVATTSASRRDAWAALRLLRRTIDGDLTPM